MSGADDTAPWWGIFELEIGQTRRWDIGPTSLWIGRFERELRVHHHQLDDPILDRQLVGVDADPDEIDESAAEHRFGFRAASATVRIEPLLADRAVVIRPEIPFRVLKSEAVTLYVSTPVWLRIGVGESGPKLVELPSFRLSDTWFGPSTIVGELCYASRTTGKLRVEDVLQRPHRALTPVRLENQSSDALDLRRLRIPVQYLALYEGPTTLWTQAVTLTREETGDDAALRIDPNPPPEADGAGRVTMARQTSEQNLVVRAFSRIFRNE